VLDALIFSKTPALLTAIYPECLWKVKTTEKVLYLTFDDGPIPEVTPLVLDILTKWHAKATFFCIGKNIEANPEVFKQVVAGGHAVANHTYNHVNGWQTTEDAYYTDIRGCNETLRKQEVETSFFRPPYGKLKPSQYNYLRTRHTIVMWDVLSYDFDLKVDKDTVLNNVLKNAEPGSIVVFHDSLKAKDKMLYALPLVLEHFSKQGFKFEALC